MDVKVRNVAFSDLLKKKKLYSDRIFHTKLSLSPETIDLTNISVKIFAFLSIDAILRGSYSTA